MKKFGTFKGVFVPSTEAILGTVLFLLLPALTGKIGFFPMLAIIILAHTVTIATTFSLADCATNLNNIGAGGMYALARRSLGKAFGGSIGIQLYFAQAASIAFYCIGFVEPLQPVIAPFLEMIPFFEGMQIITQKQVLASIVFVIFFITVMIGADFTLKIQLFILFVLFTSVISIFVSPFLGIEFERGPLFTPSFNKGGAMSMAVFFAAFTQFFPAVTGIDAGVGMSGDLKNPKKSLVKGTFASIAITFAVYIISTAVFSLMDEKFTQTKLLTELLGINKDFPLIIPGILVFTGILFATSSSALSCFMTAPRTAQSLSQNKTLPNVFNFLKYDFVKGGKEPRQATLMTFVLGISVIWMGNINVAASIVGICFLVVYGWVNGSAFLERISGNPSFRPTSKGHWLISLYGLLASISAIILFNWKVGILIILIQFLIFWLILKFKAKGKLEGVWWGVLFTVVQKSLMSFKRIVQGSKNWRPILSAVSFAGKKNCPINISYLGGLIAAFKGFVHMDMLYTEENKDYANKTNDFYVNTNKVQTDYLTTSVLTIIQGSHPAGVNPNTVLLEYTPRINSVEIIQSLLSKKKNVLMLKNGERFNKHNLIDIWWRGEKNGNLMVLLAYIINLSEKKEGNYNVRIIRKLGENDVHSEANEEMNELLEKARLKGEVVTLPYSKEAFQETLKRESKDANLIMMGIPGNFSENKDNDFEKVFNLNEIFFDKEIENYNDLPPIMFVKSAKKIDLIED